MKLTKKVQPIGVCFVAKKTLFAVNSVPMCDEIGTPIQGFGFMCVDSTTQDAITGVYNKPFFVCGAPFISRAGVSNIPDEIEHLIGDTEYELMTKDEIMPDVLITEFDTAFVQAVVSDDNDDVE